MDSYNLKIVKELTRIADALEESNSYKRKELTLEKKRQKFNTNRINEAKKNVKKKKRI